MEIVGEQNPANLIKAGTYTLLVSSTGITAGTFSTVANLGIYDDDVGLLHTGNSVTITLDHDLLPADANLDGSVNFLDASALSGGFGGGGGWASGNFNGAGTVDFLDASALYGAFGTSIPGAGATSSATVPEASSLAIMLVAMVAASVGFGRVGPQLRR